MYSRQNQSFGDALLLLLLKMRKCKDSDLKVYTKQNIKSGKILLTEALMFYFCTSIMLILSFRWKVFEEKKTQKKTPSFNIRLYVLVYAVWIN